MTRRLAGCAVVAVLQVCACSSEPTSSKPSVARSATADPVTAAVRRSFAVMDDHGGPPRPFLPDPAAVVRLDRSRSGFVVADAVDSPTGKRLDVVLPARADGAVRLEDAESRMRLAVSMEDATEAAAVVEGGYVVYRGGHAAGADVIHRPTREGTEDYLHFASEPKDEAIHYRVELHGVAGLRLVSNVLEMLDATGTPRLRMNPPTSASAAGVSSAVVSVDDCSVDTDPRAPWGRSVVPPGRDTCRVTVSFAGASYPLLVDPAWTATGSMTVSRSSHTATLLASGRVLVAGGGQAAGGIKSADLYDPATGTFATTGAMAQPRWRAAAVRLGDGRVFVAGGGLVDSTSGKQSQIANEAYDPSTGSWSTVAGALGDSNGGVVAPAAVTLANGDALVYGGYQRNTAGELWSWSATFRYLAATNAWSALANGQTSRDGHRMVLLSKPASLAGYVVAVGGYNHSVVTGIQYTNPLKNTDLFNPTTNKWSAQAPSMDYQAGGGLGVLSDTTTDFVFAIGGSNSGGTTATVEHFDPTTNTWTLDPSLPKGATGLATTYGNGLLFVTGQSADLVQMGSPVVPTSALTQSRTGFGATTLLDGRVLVTGGGTATAELYSPMAQGQPCGNGGDCSSLQCVDGFCCDQACTAANQGCSTAKTGLANGTCGPIRNGYACTTAATCGSGNCVDGVCCDSVCNTLCVACSSAKNGVADGTCAPIPDGLDPDSECNPAGSGVCALPGVCDGQGSCKNEQGVQCAAGSCASTTTYQPASTCTTAGQCQQPAPVSCGNYTCQNGACITTCNADADCTNGTKCVNPPNGTCGVGFNYGHACTSPTQCASNYCVDGVCCGSACTGVCQSCLNANTGQPDGTCAASKKGTDPHSDCQAGTGTCAPDGYCNGSGACDGNAAAGTQCGTPTCSGLSVVSPLCDGMGTCNAVTGPQCPNGYACKNGACLGSCASDGDCAPADYCNGGSCAPKLDNGGGCSGDAQCKSAHCIENVCCDAVCNGPCTSCIGLNTQGGVNGHCDVVKDGTDPKNGCAPDAGNVCGADGLCGASGQCRAAATAGTTCGTTVCVGSASVSGQVCDGNGSCTTMGATPCSNGYVCAAGSCLSQCGTSADCTAGYFCSQMACVPLLAQGAACTASAQCATGFCVDGVCCDAACTGSCQSCLGGATVGGVTGKCDDVQDGLDPKGACAADATNPCGADGTCDGQGQCRAFAIVGTVCGGNVCVGAQIAPEACNGSGTCVAGATSTCAPGYACQSGSCPTTCADDSWCTTGYFCQAGACVPLTPMGQACTADAHCATGHCADGVCCDTACTGACVSCLGTKTVGGKDGTCDAVSAGTDPRSACAPDASNACGADGQCDGNGQCRAFAPKGAACGATTCIGNASVGGKVCDGAGTCATSAGTPCAGGFVCENGACDTLCTSDAQCIAGEFCKGGTCSSKLDIGAVCTGDAQCTSGHCADGFCCDQACTGACVSCAGTKTVAGVNGQCDSVLQGLDPKNACDSDPTKPCGPDGTCDGKGQCAAFTAKGTACGADVCSGESVAKQQCDGFGACKNASPMACLPFACDATQGACFTLCTSDAECAAGAKCDPAKGKCAVSGATCKDPYTALSPNGTETSCLPYPCVAGQCQTTCSPTMSCASGYTCMGTTCVKNGGAGGASGHGGASSGGSAGTTAAGAASGAAGATSNGGTSIGGSSGAGGNGSGKAGTSGANGTSGGAATPPAAPADSGSSGGCGCIAAGSERPRSSAPAVFALLAIVVAARRRSRPRARALHGQTISTRRNQT